ncbi:hypothetical protein L798_12167 [Zootermopsis nevadensis]|uniref:Uncharacterized protein n=1 Tax=Zootermopsis nevadensis TaxID=136037 RepID=A0A067R6T5_ZOONE|nr:hypothetical protein L798_12167 [Zootermopsis nevadensis]
MHANSASISNVYTSLFQSLSPVSIDALCDSSEVQCSRMSSSCISSFLAEDAIAGFIGGMMTRIGSGFRETDKSSTWSSSSAPSLPLPERSRSLLAGAGLGVILLWLRMYLIRLGLGLGE